MSPVRPVIGVSAWLEEAIWSDLRAAAVLIEASFQEKIAEAGGVAVAVPPDSGAVGELIPMLDGVILSGGGDVDAARYRAVADPSVDLPQPRRDEGEIALVTAAIEADLPLLAVCRGIQLLNVARGGTLIQDLTDPGVRRRHQLPRSTGTARPPMFATHPVRIEGADPLAAKLGERREVFSSHHQAIDCLGDGLDPIAWAEDGVIEAVRLRGADLVVGVQWHPEAEGDALIFEALVTAARERSR